MNLFRLKEEIDSLTKQKTLFEGSLMQINEEIKKEGFKNLEDMEESILRMEKKLKEMRERYEKEVILAEDFLREIRS